MINKYAGMEYEDVVRQYADDITRLCVVWTQNEEAAKDCFQNTFLKLYQTEQTFREEEHIKAWLIQLREMNAEITTGSSGIEMWILDMCHRRTKRLALYK